MIGRRLKALAGLGLGVAMALGAAATADAAPTYTVTSFHMDSGAYETGTVKDTTSSPAINVNAYVGRIILEGTNSAGTPYSFESFCVDIFDDLRTGSGWSVSPGLDALGLGNTRTAQLTALLYNADAYIGTNLAGTGTSSDRGAAMQIALWEIINESPSSNAPVYSASSGNFTVSSMPARSLAITDANSLLSSLSTAAVPSTFQVSLVSKAGNQTQVVYANGASGLTGAVPEPATWGMMVLGFGVIGSALRCRRALANVIA